MESKRDFTLDKEKGEGTSGKLEENGKLVSAHVGLTTTTTTTSETKERKEKNKEKEARIPEKKINDNKMPGTEVFGGRSPNPSLMANDLFTEGMARRPSNQIANTGYLSQLFHNGKDDDKSRDN
jgi:hypothetical protein